MKVINKAVLASVALLLTAALLPAPASATMAGHWEGFLYHPEDTLEVILDIDRLEDGGWIGEVSIPAQGLRDFPVDVELRGDSVTMRVSNVVITGVFADDRFEGTMGEGAETMAITLERTGTAEISEERLAFEAIHIDTTTVYPLSSDGSELREVFNRDADHVRLLLLLSPS